MFGKNEYGAKVTNLFVEIKMIELASLDLMTNDPSLGSWAFFIVIITVSLMIWRIGGTIRDVYKPRKSAS